MSNQIPERLINFNVYGEGNRLLGVAEVELPSLEAMTETVSGAGIAGEVDTPTKGHFGSMSCNITWRTLNNHSFSLAEQRWHALEFWGAQQVSDQNTGRQIAQRVRVAVRAMPKNLELGTLGVSATTDTANEFEVSYLRVDIDGVKQLELDKYNFVFEVAGRDMLADVRAALGM